MKRLLMVLLLSLVAMIGLPGCLEGALYAIAEARYHDQLEGRAGDALHQHYVECVQEDNRSWDILDQCMAAKGYEVKSGR